MKQAGSVTTVIIAAIVVIGMIVGGCERKIVPSDGDIIRIRIADKPAVSTLADAIDHFTLLVEAPDFGAIFADLTAQGGFLVGQVEVPSGLHRRFVARAMDVNDTILYEGETFADVVPNRTIELTINLVPVVPLVNITPHFQGRIMGQSFSVDVNVFSLKNLNSMEFQLDFTTPDNLLTVDSIARGRDLDTTAWVGWEGTSGLTWVHIYDRNQLIPIVDTGGNAHVATFYLSSNNNGNLDLDTARFELDLVSLEAVSSGDVIVIIPIDSVYTDGALVELERRVFGTTYGGEPDDAGIDVAQTSDGGFIIAGYTYSYGAGQQDIYLIKTDAARKLQWQRTFGGSMDDGGMAVIQTSDGGYCIAGWSQSFGAGGGDGYIIKADDSGYMKWEHLFGGTATDWASDVYQTADGGYMVAGMTASFGAGAQDMYMLKLDASGNQVWDTTFGGLSSDEANALIPTSDGKFIAVGWTTPVGAQEGNLYLVKIDGDGRPIWERFYVMADDQYGEGAVPTPDGGVLVAGLHANRTIGDRDMLLFRVDGQGDSLWHKLIGYPPFDGANAITRLHSGELVIAGWTESVAAQDLNVFLVKTDDAGEVLAERIFGGPFYDEALSVAPTADGGCIVTGITYSYGVGSGDAYLLKVDPGGL